MTISAIVVIDHSVSKLEAALRSVLGQTRPPDEIMVVDKHSIVDGRDIVQKLAVHRPITFIAQAIEDKQSPRNLGISLAHGELIALLDNAAVWLPTHLEALIQPFETSRFKRLGWSYGNIDEIDVNGRLVTRSILAVERQPKSAIIDCLSDDMLLSASASLVARDALVAVGGFDERLTDYAEQDMFVRLLHNCYDCAFIDETLTQWRSQPSGPENRAGRMAYAQKLINTFPDKRDVVASRFVAKQVSEARIALAARDEVWISRCFADLHFLEQYLSPGPSPGIQRRELLITVVVPLYNGGPFIEEALRSVNQQTRQADEVIVVDDGSSDDGPAIVRRLAGEFPVWLITQANAGQSAARNVGVEQAHGDVVAFLDQDDIWYPDHLERLVRPFLESRSIELGWTYSDMDEIDEHGRMVSRNTLTHHNIPHPKRDLVTCLKRDMFILPSSAMVSRRAFQHVGGFDLRLSGYEDDDLFLRMFRSGYDSVFLPASLSKWRIYGTSSSYSPRMAKSRATYIRMLLERFPDDVDSSRYFVRDMIAPRFFRVIAAELRRCVLKGNEAGRLEAMNQLSFILGYMRVSFRVPFRLFVMPAMRIPFMLRLMMRCQGPAARILRHVL